MKTQYQKSISIWLSTLLLSVATPLLAAVDDELTSHTVEGVEMKFQVTNESPKTCKVGSYGFCAISDYTYGVVTIPSTVEGYKVTAIGESAFVMCSGLTKVVIPGTVTAIGEYAFFQTNLTTVTIPNSIKTIEKDAFYGCNKLTSVNLPNSVTTIGNGAFERTGLTNVIIPNSVVTIGTNPFAYCSNLKSLAVEDGNTVYHSQNDCIVETRSKTLIAGCRNSYISDDIASIGDYAFRGCTGLTWIRIYNSVTSIGYRAFYGCSSITYIDCLIEKLLFGTLPFPESHEEYVQGLR